MQSNIPAPVVLGMRQGVDRGREMQFFPFFSYLPIAKGQGEERMREGFPFYGFLILLCLGFLNSR